jgi:Bifunctional nuclease domain
MLKERIGDRVLEFGIGAAEAAAIAMALQGVRQPRPMTHDLIGNLLGALDDVSVLRVMSPSGSSPQNLLANWPMVRSCHWAGPRRSTRSWSCGIVIA